MTRILLGDTGSMSLAKNLRLCVAAGLFASALACGGGDGAEFELETSDPTSEPREKTGSVSFALTTQGDLTFHAFRYAITGPAFSKAGSIDVSESTTVSALIEGIPAGTGYSMTLTGTSVAPPQATCSGSAAFDVAAGAMTSVPISVACRASETPPPAPAVPIPPFAPVVLGLCLLVVGALPAVHRRRRSC